ncbi:COX15/CtaA family protein [Flavobacterium wongokense]|uniref:COX15/CtaA family protein n=1 Tax=Flavobacterium wongokense TaxID=2910674 RepID=UPI001F30369F|nr:COX15/CtaA family protein [Flavobacterium sp. WG47]MCF6132573.1 COX15/CtaA family protein [Flavobacterium sp. WG47]
MKNRFPKAAKIALIFVYAVIVAGALVRMTGSGMGCPDWPKCFGYYIPPTDIKQLTWSKNRDFKKGQVIIKDETLLVAKDNFKTSTQFDASHWEKYTKHDYAIFNVYHTWVEYVNRLVGALAGLACFIMAVFSFSYWNEKRKITWLSWLVVFMMGFQGWLGAKVVYSVLNPIKITLHMVVALIIVAVILYIIRLTGLKKEALKFNSNFRKLMVFSLGLSLIQIILGTQVRQFVDEQVKNGVNASIMWLQNPTLDFYLHRSFSIIVLLVNLYLFNKNRIENLGFYKMNWVLFLIGIEIITGISMAYFDFPFGSQAIHLIIASILFGLQFYMVLESRKSKSVTI